MPGSARIGDIGSGHGCFPATPIVAGSSNVFVNGIPAARVGDALASHCCPDNGCHGRAIASGSNTVFINGIPAARCGDSISCGGSVATCSNNVNIG